MEETFVSIFHNNVKTSLRNALFDIRKNKMTEVATYTKLRNFLSKRKVYINTYDIPVKKPPFKYVHYDLPYPLTSNFSVWKSIFLNRGKNILICTEPPMVNPFNYMKIFHTLFLKVYTWNDDLVDNKKYFRIGLPKSSLGFNTRAQKFNQKKFLALINSNKLPFFPFKQLSSFGRELYSERIKAIEFFEKNIPDKFFLYGKGWNKPKRYNLKEWIKGFKKYSTYKGEVSNKIKILSNFKYCLCFENLTDVNGYITEKIFDCFKAKCVPIYWGASNIEKYIPKNCFIDFREFKDFKKLLIFLDSIDEKKYNSYIENMKGLLADKRFVDLWFENGFSEFFLKDILEIKGRTKSSN